MNPVLLIFTNWLADFAALSTLLLIAALAARWLLHAASQRIAIAWGAWLGLVLLAILTALPNWPRVSLSKSPRQPRPPLAAVALEFDVDITVLPPESRTPPTPRRPTPAENLWVTAKRALLDPALVSMRAILALAWLMTAGLATVWIAVGLVQTWRLILNSYPAPAWMHELLTRLVGKRRREPALHLSPKIATAAAVGFVCPRILLPQTATDERSAPAVRAALAHEWAHIRHGDLWLLALERLLLPLLAWHPLFWLMRRGVRFDQELLADDAAAGGHPLEYAEALVAWARAAQPASVALAGLSLWESPHTLSRRIAMLVDPNRGPSTIAHRGWQTVGLFALLGMSLGLSIVSLAPLTAQERSGSRGAAESSPIEELRFIDQPIGDAPSTVVIKLQGGDAAQRAEMLKSVLGDGSSPTRPLRLTADARTNSIVAIGTEADVKLVIGILERLEQPASNLEPTVPRVPAPPTRLPEAVVPPSPGAPAAPAAPATSAPVARPIPSSRPSAAPTAPAAQVVRPLVQRVPVAADAQVALNCIILEIDVQELREKLPEVEHGAQPSPQLSVIVQTNHKWQSTLETLREAGSAKILSMPKMIVIDRQTAMCETTTKPESSSNESDNESDKTYRLSLVVTPKVELPVPGSGSPDSQRISLSIEGKEYRLEPSSENKPKLRTFRTEATAETGKTVIVADRSAGSRALLVVVEPQVISGSANANTNTVSAGTSAGRRTGSGATSATQRPPNVSETQVLQELRELRQEIDRLLAEQRHGPAAAQAASAAEQWAAERLQSAAQREQDQAEREKAIAERRAKHATQIKLLALDLQDAQLEVEAARAEFERLQQQRKKGTVSEAEVARAKVELGRAEIRLEKLTILLDAEKQAANDP